MKNLGKITLGWWNTSLSPHSKENKSTDEHKQYVAFTLIRLLNERNIDAICLCEVSQLDVEFISEVVGDGFSVYDGVYREGRKKFDICIIFRSDVLQLADSTVISKLHPTGNRIYAGQKVEFVIMETQEPLTLFLVHWSSRLYDYEDSPKKAELGMLLRTAVSDCFEQAANSKIIVLGDFNEEPFNESITYHLAATRDIALVKRRPGLLYNPFWRHMNYSKMHPNSDTSGVHGGTYYYKNDDFSKWKTFDQMMFSSDFISGKTWHLNESETVIFSDPDFLQYINNSSSKFDHLPIISVIERIDRERL
ncbi:hypothetical protein C1N60_04985 [Pantoea sp. SGAir0184]